MSIPAIRFKTGAFILLLLSLMACQDREFFTIEGKFDNSLSKRVFLAEIIGNQTIPIDSSGIGPNGAFKFKVKPLNPKFFLVVSDQIQVPVLGEKGTTVFLKSDLKDSTGNYTLYGNDENQKLWELNKSRIQGSLSMNHILEDFPMARTSEDTATLLKKGMKIKEDFRDSILAFVQRNSNSLSSIYALNFLDADRDYAAYQSVAKGAGIKFKGIPMADSIQKIVQEGFSTSIGQKMTDIKLADPSGKIHSLEEFKGKYVMIDFWASWCGPCRRENPENLKLYQTYKEKGFTIYGVSLDKDKSSWERAIQEDHLPWVQVSDLKYWDSPVVTTFHFNAIPHNIMIDPKGIIIGKNLHGEDLANFLKQHIP